MQNYFLFGKYSSEAVKEIGAERTKKAIVTIEQFGGRVHAMHALLGEHDLIINASFSNTEDVIKASIALNKFTGISFTTAPAISVDEFDKLVDQV
jgi:uncharacterized protein with GYD domain